MKNFIGVSSLGFLGLVGFFTGMSMSSLTACQNGKIERASIGDNAFDKNRVSATTTVTENIEYQYPAGLNGSSGRISGGAFGVSSGGILDASSGSLTFNVPWLPALKYDENFCAGLKLGECFTFVMQIPSSKMQESLGLSTLSIMQHASTYRGKLGQACDLGLQSSLPALVDESGVSLIQKQGTGRRLFSRVKKSRCIIHNMFNETQQLPQLHDNEFGFSARLVEFEVGANSVSTNPAIGIFKFENTKLNISFHDPFVFAKNGVAKREWLPVRSWRLFNNSRIFGIASKQISIGQTVTFEANYPSTAAYLKDRLLPAVDNAAKWEKGKGLVVLDTQLSNIREAIKIILAKTTTAAMGSATKSHAAIFLVALGINAIRDICTYDNASCNPKFDPSNDLVSKMDELFHGKTDIVGSQLRATFNDSLKFIPYSLISAIIDEADKTELKGILN